MIRLRTNANQPMSGVRYSTPDLPQWDECSRVYLCTGDTAELGGFEEGTAFPGAPGFLVSALETEPIQSGLYTLTLRGLGVKRKRHYARTIPGSASHGGSNVKVAGVPGPNADGSWPTVDVFVPALGFEVTYVGADSYSESSANNPARLIGTAVTAPLVVAGFPAVAFPPAPGNPWATIRPDQAKLLYPFGWVVSRADGPALSAGMAASPHLLTLGYTYRWKVIPGGA